MKEDCDKKQRNRKKSESVRYLWEISEDELIEAVIALCRTLNIAGSTNEYDLYEAVARERLRAIENHRWWLEFSKSER